MSAEEIQRAAYELSWGRMTESGKLQAFSVLSGEESWQFFVAEMALTYLGGDDLGFPRPLLVEEILKRVAFPILGNESVPVALQQSVATFVLQEIQSESDPSYLTAERRTLTLQWLVLLFGTEQVQQAHRQTVYIILL